MGQVINTNIASLNAQLNLNRSQNSLNTALQRLSSGLRINSAKDDAAGLAIANSMTSQIRGLNVAARNASDAISLAQTAEGALTELTNIMQRMRDLGVQAANDSNTDENRRSLQLEVDQLIAEVDRIATTTTYNGRNILDGSLGTMSFHVGAGANETITFTTGNVKSAALGEQPGRVQTEGARVSTTQNAADAGTQGIQEGSMTMVLSTGDLTVQVDSEAAVDITSTANGGDISLSAEAGAQSNAAKKIAERINEIRESGTEASFGNVFATASTSFRASDLNAADYTGTAVPAAGSRSIAQGSLTTGQLQINGFAIGPASFEAKDADGSLTAAINARTDVTGVRASVDDAGELILTADDGRDIILTLNEAGAETLFGSGAGGSFDAGLSNLRVTGNVKVTANGQLTFAGTDPENGGLNGVKTGTVANAQATGTLATADVTSIASANSLIESVDSALRQVDTIRAQLGAVQNRFESTINNLTSVAQNLSSARSRILDADFAQETANLTRAQILQQAGVSILSQANSSQQNVLSLLQQ